MRYGHGYGDGASGTTLQGDAHHLEEEASLQVNGDPRNASDVESKGTVNGWSISDAQSTEGSVLWEACRYYEVGDVREGVQQVISNATLGDNLGLAWLEQPRLTVAVCQKYVGVGAICI